MLTFYNEHHAQHEGRFEMDNGVPGPSSERAERAALVLAEFERRDLGQVVTPHGVSLASLERVHSPRYLHFLRNAWSEWLALEADNQNRDAYPTIWPIRGMRADIEPASFKGRMGLYSMDGFTPLTAGTWNAAKTGAACAINAAHALRMGQRSTFALTRPPGHHAGADFYGGHCYLNNAALAAQHMLDDGAAKVAIIDLDYHHGNGAQSIFYQRADVLTVSLHGDPQANYPYFLGHADETGDGPGRGFNMNVCVPPGASAATYMAALETACIKLQMFAPDALVVALGVDTYCGDSQSSFKLASADFLRIGERLGFLNLPAVFVLEGGQAVKEIGVNVVNVLEGFETAN